MIVSNRDVKTIYFCPRKARFEIKNMQRVSEGAFSTEAFGCTLVAEPDEIVSTSPMHVKIYKTGRKLSDYHFIEAAFLGYVLESCGYEVGSIIFESPGFYSTTVNWRPFVTRMLALLSHFCTETDFKISKTHLCKTCQFSGRCFLEARETESIDFLHGLRSSTVQKLKSAGIETIRNLLDRAQDVELLLGKERGTKICAQARSLMLQEPVVFRGLPVIEDGVVIDIESYTPHDFDYLFGVLAGDTYYPFLARDLGEERVAFEHTLEFLSATEGPIYHFHQYEVQRFKKLSKKYGIPVPGSLFKRFVDVYKLYADHVALPVPSYSLKALARFFGFEWRNGMNGKLAVEAFEKFLNTGDETVLREILVYNEDDVRATELLVKELQRLKVRG